jgi:hypothetical protein
MAAKSAARKRGTKSAARKRKGKPIRGKKAGSATKALSGKVLGALRRELIEQVPESPDRYAASIGRGEV